MRCRDAAERLALYVEGDLPPAVGEGVKAHLARCAACRRLCERFLESQSAFKSLRRDVLDPSVLGDARGRLLTRVEGHTASLAIRAERYLVVRFRRQPYALAGVGLAAAALSLYGLFGLTGDHATREFVSPASQAAVSSEPEPVGTPAGVYTTGRTDTAATEEVAEALEPRAAEPVHPPSPEAVEPTIGLSGPGTETDGSVDRAVGMGFVDPAPEPEAEPVLVRVVTDHPDLIIYWLIDGKGDGV